MVALKMMKVNAAGAKVVGTVIAKSESAESINASTELEATKRKKIATDQKNALENEYDRMSNHSYRLRIIWLYSLPVVNLTIESHKIGPINRAMM